MDIDPVLYTCPNHMQCTRMCYTKLCKCVSLETCRMLKRKARLPTVTVLGPYGSGTTNSNTTRLLTFCASCNLAVLGSWFKRRRTHRMTANNKSCDHLAPKRSPRSKIQWYSILCEISKCCHVKTKDRIKNRQTRFVWMSSATLHNFEIFKLLTLVSVNIRVICNV